MRRNIRSYVVEKHLQCAFCVARTGDDDALRVLEGSVDATEKLRIIRRIAAGLPSGPAVVQALQGGVGMKIHLGLLVRAKPTNFGLGVIDPDNCVITVGHVKPPLLSCGSPIGDFDPYERAAAVESVN